VFSVTVNCGDTLTPIGEWTKIERENVFRKVWRLHVWMDLYYLNPGLEVQ
jgi:hypothetical protein